MMESLTLTLGAAVAMGLAFGAGPCNIACLPYLGPLFLTPQSRWRSVALFSAGRLAGYTALAAAAGLFGEALQHFIKGSWGAWLLGMATLLMGAMLWQRNKAGSCARASDDALQPLTFIPRRASLAGQGSLFMMGFGLALNPCTPLSALLLAAAATQSALSGASLGIAFGLGAVVVPALLFGLLIAHLGQEVRHHLAQWQGPLTRGVSVLLMALGGATLVGWIAP